MKLQVHIHVHAIPFHWYIYMYSIFLTLNVRGQSYLCLTRSISWLLMTCSCSLRRHDISTHDIDYVEMVSPCLTWWRIPTTCVISMWSNDIKCKCMFLFPLKNLACKGLRVGSLNNLDHTQQTTIFQMFVHETCVFLQTNSEIQLTN